MLKGFKERCTTFENEFAHQNTIKFRATARRDKLVGEWAAEQLGLTGEADNDYQRTISRAQIVGGEDCLIKKLAEDLQIKSADISVNDIHQKIYECLEKAMAEHRQK